MSGSRRWPRAISRRAAPGGEEVPPAFATAIEAFIATALAADDAERRGLGAAVRCVVTLERERVYNLVLARVRAHLDGRATA